MEFEQAYLMTISVEADFHVIGQVGERVPSPRIFLADWAPGFCSALFLFLPLACVGVETEAAAATGLGSSDSCFDSGNGTAITVGGTTASVHWQTACSSDRTSYRSE